MAANHALPCVVLASLALLDQTVALVRCRSADISVSVDWCRTKCADKQRDPRNFRTNLWLYRSFHCLPPRPLRN